MNNFSLHWPCCIVLRRGRRSENLLQRAFRHSQNIWQFSVTSTSSCLEVSELCHGPQTGSGEPWDCQLSHTHYRLRIWPHCQAVTAFTCTSFYVCVYVGGKNQFKRLNQIIRCQPDELQQLQILYILHSGLVINLLAHLKSSSRSHSVWCLICNLFSCSPWVCFSSWVTRTWMGKPASLESGKVRILFRQISKTHLQIKLNFLFFLALTSQRLFKVDSNWLY